MIGQDDVMWVATKSTVELMMPNLSVVQDVNQLIHL